MEKKKKKTMKKKVMWFLTNVALPAAISVATKVIIDKYSNNDDISIRVGELEDTVNEIQDILEDEDRGAYTRGYLDGVDDYGE